MFEHKSTILTMQVEIENFQISTLSWDVSKM